MLKIQDLYKHFQSTYQPVLNNINLNLEEGEFCVLIGCNGSGKSTLLKIINGEHKLDSGKIILDKQDITHTAVSKRASFISSVSQDISKGTIEEMTLLENLVLGSLRNDKAHYKFYKNQIRNFEAQIKELCLGIEQYFHTKLSALSGGQRQIIATIMATLSPSKLLLLDEHTSALDPKNQNILMEYTYHIVKKTRITTLMVTHNLNDALKYGNRLIMLHQGTIVIDVKDKYKKSLTLTELLKLFHYYEDFSLIEQKERI